MAASFFSVRFCHGDTVNSIPLEIGSDFLKNLGKGITRDMDIELIKISERCHQNQKICSFKPYHHFIQYLFGKIRLSFAAGQMIE